MSKGRPLISIITATRNRRDLLERLVASVAAQDYPAKEHVVVDGASNDGTLEFLREATVRYPHLRWISEPDSGISEAFNKGMALARGEIMATLGDDDVVLPGAFEAVAAAFEKRPAKTGIISGHSQVVIADESDRNLSRASFSSRGKMIECWRYWGSRVMFPGPSTYFTREVVDRIGGFRPEDRYAMDYDFLVRATEGHGVVIIDKVLANFRFDRGNLSFDKRGEQREETIAISRRYWGSRWKWRYWELRFSLFRYRLRQFAGGLKRSVLGVRNETR